MTQRKEKTGICKSVIIATVVAIRDVVEIVVHCNKVYASIWQRSNLSFALKNIQLYLQQNASHISPKHVDVDDKSQLFFFYK